MISPYSSALSALNGFATKLQSNGNNIANANTDGFKKTRVTHSITEAQGINVQIEKVVKPGTSVFKETVAGMEMVELSNVDLASELTDLNLNSHFYKANLKTLETLEEMSGELLDIKS